MLFRSEVRRLEGLMAKIPDDPGNLLSNRFVLELRLRKRRHLDLGPEW